MERIPIEFDFHVFLDFPYEDIQIQAWSKWFPHLSDDTIVDIVERFPMHLQEINLVARQTELQAMLNDVLEIDKNDLIATTRRLRKIEKTPLLFGAN